MAHVLIRLGVPGIAASDIEDLIEPRILNRSGQAVGSVRAIADMDRIPDLERRNVLI